MAVAVVVRLPAAATVQTRVAVMGEATVAVADLAEAPAPRTPVSRARILATDSHPVSHVKPRHRANAMHRNRESTENSSAKTRAVRAWIHALNHAVTLTSVSLPAMFLRDSPHLASLQAVTAAASAALALAAAVAAQVVVDAATALAALAAHSAVDKKKRAL
jgi:hypothetical protein